MRRFAHVQKHRSQTRSLAKLDLTNAGVAGADLAHLSRGLHAAHVDGNVERTLVLRDNPDITSRHRADLKQSLGRTVELEGDSDDDDKWQVELEARVPTRS